MRQVLGSGEPAGLLHAIDTMREDNAKRAYQYFKFVVKLINTSPAAERHLKRHRAQWQTVVHWLDVQLTPSAGYNSGYLNTTSSYHSTSSNEESDRHTFLRTISACSTLERAKEVLVRPSVLVARDEDCLLATCAVFQPLRLTRSSPWLGSPPDPCGSPSPRTKLLPRRKSPRQRPWLTLQPPRSQRLRRELCWRRPRKSRCRTLSQLARRQRRERFAALFSSAFFLFLLNTKLRRQPQNRNWPFAA